MGLDMYIHAIQNATSSQTYEDVVTIINNNATNECISTSGQSSSQIELGYWRKANAIHKWLVDNVQNGVDDCGLYPIHREHMIDLRHTCKKALDAPEQACKILPTSSGFFFGDVNYDNWYFDQLKYTVNLMDNLILIEPKIDWKLCYHSSW